MRILIVSPSYKPAYIYGGPIVVVALLAETLVQIGHEVTVYTTTANGKGELPVSPNKKVIVNGVDVYYFKRNTGDHTHVSFPLWKQLKATARDFDVVHLHSWWSLLMFGAAWICKKKRIVPILSPHGMFSDYILETNNAFKKTLLHILFGKRLLWHTRLHVSSQMEWEECQAIVPGWSGAVIPNLVELPSVNLQKKENEIFTIGFLSRIDPKKGLDILLTALSQVDFPYRLHIGGSGDAGYVHELQRLALGLGIAPFVEWKGWQNGEEKFKFLSGLDLLSLTSYSENFAIVVIEALSLGTPVLVSNRVGLYTYVEDNEFGWVTDLEIDKVANTLTNAFLDKEKRKKIQLESPHLIRKDFEPGFLASRYIELYKTISINS